MNKYLVDYHESRESSKKYGLAVHCIMWGQTTSHLPGSLFQTNLQPSVCSKTERFIDLFFHSHHHLT